MFSLLPCEHCRGEGWEKGEPGELVLPVHRGAVGASPAVPRGQLGELYTALVMDWDT